MFLFFPTSTEVFLTRWPWGNIALLSLCGLFGLAVFFGVLPIGLLESMALEGWGFFGLFGHIFLHVDVLHLAFNMLYLWVFGNAVNETVGSLKYLGVFIALGILSAIIHNLVDGRAAIGASGAINGIIGFYLILFPINRVTCAYFFIFRPGTFQVSGYWLIILWFLGDVFGALGNPSGQIAYWAHLGGLFAGIGLGIIYETTGMAHLEHYDNPSLIDLLVRRGKPKPVARQPRRSARQIIEDHRQEDAQKNVLQFDEPLDETTTVACPHCTQKLDVPAEFYQQVIECPVCSGSLICEGQNHL